MDVFFRVGVAGLRPASKMNSVANSQSVRLH